MMHRMMQQTFEIWLWGLVATALMTTILQGSQGLGLSRLSLPFLFGTFFTSDRRRAVLVGSVTYLTGGWMFAGLYYLIFVSLGFATWWLGCILGALHGVFLLVSLPAIAQMHPRVASEYDAPSGEAKLEPPGFMGLNYGAQTPLSTILAQTLYGGVLGAFLRIQ